MELMAVPKTEAATMPPPPPRRTLPAAKVAAPLLTTPAPTEEPQLTWEEAADVIAAVRSQSKLEGRSTAVDYDCFCREELAHHGADVTHVPPLTIASPTLLLRCCRDGEQEDNLGTDRTNTVVSTVVENTFPTASTEHKAELVDVWEKVPDSWGHSALGEMRDVMQI